MVDIGCIHREFGKFLMISSNLIKSDNELMIEIGEMVFYERELQDDSTESKIIEFDFDFAKKLKIKVRDNFRKSESRILRKSKEINLK